MHTFSENSSGVPAFLAKLWRLVEDDETNNLIYWSAVSKTIQLISNRKRTSQGKIIRNKSNELLENDAQMNGQLERE